ncbi:hypothetical protein DFR55_103103 [Herbinix hemicellulosilytica]|uniref:Secreted protein n=1 Tax=Herbinix hemicellulosilytica TaxID=1564487 RepID=A0A0H5SU47_HERHM|nr:hypothetical protein [Herbinix hemicellulosilytica]RBP60119.1 hypothetical protein DFR55_103103 [Herbinix hemicellulosilytica]CRZ33843.1 hypothetical protein HHT355_0639 [Herbinix hemicellulosilytica]HPU63866.1 hypothetical protein [Mobilitalea sp.]
MRKILLLLILISVILGGCGTKDNSSDVNGNDKKTAEEVQTDEKQNEQQEPSGYAFEYNGVTIYMNTDVKSVIDKLGDPLNYFEAESCAFKGLDKFYTYPGFEITTYPMNGKDYISSVNLMDDTVSTPEGIYLGSTVDDMIAAYGDNYTESSGSYTYIKDDSKIQFIVKDDEIISITYLAIVEGLE